jgi:NADH-quinone oxidoreductase subunit I
MSASTTTVRCPAWANVMARLLDTTVLPSDGPVLVMTMVRLVSSAEEKSTDVEHGMGPWSVSPRWRGTHRMLTDEQGRSKCVACGLCPQICPANCIKLVPGEDEQGHRYPLIYEIDEFRCVFCGYCQEVCPEEAIHVGVHYENAEYSRDRFVYDLERLSSQTHAVSTLWDPADPRGE